MDSSDKIPLCEETRAFYDQLADHNAGFEKMRNSWLETVASASNKMPFIAVDPSEIVKPYGKDFDYLSIIRDASDPSKRLIARVKVFIKNVPFKNYRLWNGVQNALQIGA